MVTVTVVEHEPDCPPAHVGTWLVEAGAELDVRRPWAGDALPDPGDVEGLVVLGGSMGAHDDEHHHWLGPLKQLVRDCVAGSTPVLGVCLGHQLVAAALGGTSERNPRGQQVGLYAVGWTAEAPHDRLVGDLGPVRGIQWNDDVVTDLPDGTVVLARTPEGELQVARFAERVWGVQLHPEADELVLASWVEGDRDAHAARGLDTDAVLVEIAGARAELDAAWRPLAGRFVDLVRGDA